MHLQDQQQIHFSLRQVKAQKLRSKCSVVDVYQLFKSQSYLKPLRSIWSGQYYTE